MAEVFFGFTSFATWVIWLTVLVFGIVGIFKRKNYYVEHSHSFHVGKAVGFSLYLLLGFFLANFICFIPFEIALMIENLSGSNASGIEYGTPSLIGVVIITLLGAYMWYLGYKAISRKIDEMTEAEHIYLMEDFQTHNSALKPELIDSKKMRFRMWLAGIGSITMFWVKVFFWWFVVFHVVMSIISIFSNDEC